MDTSLPLTTPRFSSLPHGYRALVVGASGALGGAFVTALRQDPGCAGVHTLSRSGNPGFDLTDESSLAQASGHLAAEAPFHLVVDATGALTLGGRGPEKHLGALNIEDLTRQFQVNAAGPALLMKHLVPLLATGERAIYAKLSARVGSIADNRKGGWYGYRAAKAALNMLLHTAAIECARKRPLLVVAAMQPGTVRSALSTPFVTAGQALDPAASVAGLMRALDGLPPQPGAHFIDHRGSPIPW